MNWAITEKGYSQRSACRLVGIDPRVYRYRSARGDDAALRRRLRELSSERRRFGYRRLHIRLWGQPTPDQGRVPRGSSFARCLLAPDHPMSTGGQSTIDAQTASQLAHPARLRSFRQMTSRNISQSSLKSATIVFNLLIAPSSAFTRRIPSGGNSPYRIYQWKCVA